MNTPCLPEIVWHYTTGALFMKIVESGFLLPTSVGVQAPELPVLWFSKHPVFEPTARKAVLENGKIRVLSVRETFERGGGLVRFGVKPEGLYQATALRAAAKIPRRTWKALESIAHRQGSNSQNWWGTTEALPIDSIVIEVMDEDMTWKRVQGEGAMVYR